MKKKNIITILVAALLILAVLFVAFIIPRIASESFRAKNDISKYLRAVERGNYDRAVKYVDLDDGLSTDEWIERISSLDTPYFFEIVRIISSIFFVSDGSA